MPIIRPQITVTPDCPTVKFREDPNNIDLAVELPKILASQGWGLGAIFTIQFINHERTALIKSARFVVTSEDSSIQTFNPNGPQPMTKLVEARQAKQMENWFYPEGSPADGLTRNWNFGEKKHQVMRGEEVIASFEKKEQAEEFIKKAA